MQHRGTVLLETPRLVLRRFVESDADAAFRNWEGDASVTKFLRWQAYTDPATAAQTLRAWIARYEDPAFYQWAIVPKELGEPIGTISVVDQDARTRMVHIGYCIGSRWWGRGFMSEAFSAVIDFFFDEVGVNRIESMHDPNNPASGRVMQKCGLSYEGTLRQADWNNQGIVDACMYAILASDDRGR